MRGSNAPEKDRRCKASAVAYHQLRAFWDAGGPFSVRRTVFFNGVVGAGLSGLTAYVWTDNDSDDIEKVIVKYARVALLGKAHTENAGKHSQWTKAQVLAHWRIGPIAVELRCQRLKSYQSRAAEPENFAQILAAIFGRMRCEKNDTCDDMGALAEHANPWARQAAREFDELG